MENRIKKQLIEKVFEKAKAESRKKTKNSLADYLSVCLEEKFRHPISERTLVRYYDYILLEKKPNHFIDENNLDVFSEYLGHKNYAEFFALLSKDTINTELPYKGKVQRSLGFKQYVYISLSIFLALSIWQLLPATKKDKQLGFERNKENTTVKTTIASRDSIVTSPSHSDLTLPQNEELEEHATKTERKKECMYWNEDHYEEVFCDELIEGKTIIALNNEIKLIRKITSPDTLTIENALGKVWYDKSNKKVVFFTHYGIHPENGKTLKPITRYMINKYIYGNEN